MMPIEHGIEVAVPTGEQISGIGESVGRLDVRHGHDSFEHDFET